MLSVSSISRRKSSYIFVIFFQVKRIDVQEINHSQNNSKAIKMSDDVITIWIPERDNKTEDQRRERKKKAKIPSRYFVKFSYYLTVMNEEHPCLLSQSII